MTDLLTASKRLASSGGNHTNYQGCFDGFPERWELRDIPDDVNCEACQAIKAWFRALDRAAPLAEPEVEGWGPIRNPVRLAATDTHKED